MKQIIFATILGLGFGLSVFAQSENSSCPKIEINGGGVVRPGEPMTFIVKLENEAKFPRIEYEWTVSNGTISGGQASPVITVDTTSLETNITATVKIKGLPENCADTASETGNVSPIKDIFPIDEFGKLPNDEVKARMDALFVSLGNEPNGQGYILNYGTDEEVAVREKQIQKAINYRKYDASRVTVVRCGANPNGAGVWTKVWIVPPGADNPQP